MKLLVALLAVTIVFSGCGVEKQGDIETAEVEPAETESIEAGCIAGTLLIEWQRLVDDDGKTCDRCGTTQQEVHIARDMLKKSLSPLCIEVVLEARPLTPAECAKDISQSNRIWIAGRPLEEWLDAGVGMSACGGCCEAEFGGEVECRTLVYQGQTYEAIPANLIVRAGLAAAATIGSGCGVSCDPTGSCCPGD